MMDTATSVLFSGALGFVTGALVWVLYIWYKDAQKNKGVKSRYINGQVVYMRDEE